MNDADLDTEQSRALFTQAYQKLNPVDRQIMQLTSVIYEPANRSLLMACLIQAGIKDSANKPFTDKVLKTHIDRLVTLGLLVQERGQGPQCHGLIVEIATRDAITAGTFDTFVKVVEAKIPISRRNMRGPRHFQRQDQFLREMRIGLYRGDLDYISQVLTDYEHSFYLSDHLSMDEIMAIVYDNPFDPEWFRRLPPMLYENGLASILIHSVMECSIATAPFDLLRQDCANGPSSDSELLQHILLEQLLLRGQVTAAEQWLTQFSGAKADSMAMFRGWIAFLRGDIEQSIRDYTLALKALKKTSGKRQVYFSSLSGLFFILALLKQGSAASLREADGHTALMAKQPNHWLRSTYAYLRKVLLLQQGDLSQKDSLTTLSLLDDSHSFDMLFYALCTYWVDGDRAKRLLPDLLDLFYEEAIRADYRWFAMEVAEMLSRLQDNSPYRQRADALRQDSGILPLVDVIQAQEAWELCLNALANLQRDPQGHSKPASHQRLAWFITFHSTGCQLQPREQKIDAKGQWGKGRPVALKRLSEKPADFDYLTPQDLRTCAQIETHHAYGSYGYYGKTEYEFGERAIAALIGHPLVFWEGSPTVRVEIVKGEPELFVKKSKAGWLTLEFSTKLPEDKDLIVIKETPTRLKVIEIQPEHRRIAEIIGRKNRLEVPEVAKERVLAAINAVSSVVTVQSDIGGGGENAEEVAADSKPHVHLLPAGEGLKVALLSRPFVTDGPYYRPGTGGATVIAEIDGKRLQATRNLKEEKALAKATLAACPTLADQEEQDGEWLVADPEQCLELLVELQTLEDQAVVEWPEGEKLRVSHQAGLGNFHMAIRQQRDWFAAEGELKLDDNLVLDMQQLMTLLDQTSSRFVPLGDGQFLALTQEFRKRLDELRAFADRQGKGVRFHPLATMALEEFVDEVGELKADKHWKAHIKRMKDMQTLQPQLPSTLQAELRDYQLEGFNWLARLAHWGVGACLADDMGLGKTLQALAVILTRAPDGPTLIVAPTSVCMNWMGEAQKFAPTLNIIQFGSGDRQKLLDQLQPFDMLVCSYGLLQQEEVGDMLAKVSWQTIVLDEAQAIKNMATKRSQAAMNLQGGFKLITTGTPIENHLGELWNLFRFINPGLLGSLDNFNQNFANPIERYQDKAARQRLKKLIQPFLLRRRKSQVLAELPSRTEITLHVDLSREEMALYEALRREAIAKLSESDAAAGQKHLQVLAEIMRLRRMCCNPRLVMPEAPLPSSKLHLFGEVLEELLDNQHKALVFSQFVDHLHILQEYLDEHKIRYQYLDGSTPAAERKKRVDAFQAGNGDVFLISLKAGGTGLNLTAADYVIHMDPWWNPAVEDQASDRAHRIGQQRPVTIYRLVAKGTIEEKIVDLHHQKRDLADSLLEGTDMSSKVSTDELLRLIQAG